MPEPRASADEAARAVVATTETYYDSDEADRFYHQVWGGEDIHIGLYASDHAVSGGAHRGGANPRGVSIRDASAATVTRMADRAAPGLEMHPRILDLGAGYGGSARALVARFDAHVTCLNLSTTQNRRNQSMNREAGLSDRVEVVHGNFESLPFEAASFDLVWSQDALLHSSRREQVLHEARRVLRPGGQMLFTDPMQADDCPDGVLGPVLDRIHLSSLASPRFYRESAARVGFKFLAMDDLSLMLPRHYEVVRAELRRRYDEMVAVCGAPYVDRMLVGLGHWIDAGRAGYLTWGILHLRTKRER
ncbi:MAG: class I SAM-dependent methyltransferase [Myxococcota bacterium]